MTRSDGRRGQERREEAYDHRLLLLFDLTPKRVIRVVDSSNSYKLSVKVHAYASAVKSFNIVVKLKTEHTPPHHRCTSKELI